MVQLDVEGEKPFRAVVSRWDAQITDIEEVADDINEAFIADQKRSFRSEGASSGPKWAPLSPLYKRWKSKNYPGMPILQRTGRLRASLTLPGHPEHGFAVLSKTTMQVGTEVPYAIHHQAGSTSLPRRPIIRFTSRFRKAVESAMHARLLKIRDEALSGKIRAGQ